jgi:hypothetical protein
MPTLTCPICHREVAYVVRDEVPYRPFCSRRCKLVDLGRWLNEEYRISEELAEPGVPDDADPDGARGDPE